MYLRYSKNLKNTVKIPEVILGKHKHNTLRMTLPSEPVDPQDPYRLRKPEPEMLSEPADVYSVRKVM